MMEENAFERIGNQAKEIREVFDDFIAMAQLIDGKKKAGTGIRSKAPRNIASRKPVGHRN